MNRFLRGTGVVMCLIALAGCVPSDISEACKRKAIQRGYGKCSVEKGRQNSFGVWTLKMSCSRGEVSCLNNTAGSVDIFKWTSSSEFLYNQ